MGEVARKDDLLLEQHIADEGLRYAGLEAEIREIRVLLEGVVAAVPKDQDGRPDFAAHRAYHEARNRAAAAEERFYNELRLEVAKRGLLFLLSVVGGLVMLGLSFKIFGGFIDGHFK